MSSTDPDLSVILIVGDKRDRAVDCLRSLMIQNARLEILLIDCGMDAAPLPGSENPPVRRIQLPPGTNFGRARAEGVRQARSGIVAFIEEHCVVLPGWAEALVAAHQGPWAGVGGEVYNANAGVGLSDAFYLAGYAPWTPPAERGESELVASHNSSYRREVLLAFGERLDGLLLSEPILQWKLKEGNHRLFVEPGAKFMHHNEIGLQGMLTYYWWSRSFGHRRADTFHWSRWRRIVTCCLSPALPWLRTARLFKYVARHCPQRLWAFFSNLPAIVLVYHVAVLGEVSALVAGKGPAEDRFTELELNHHQ